MISVTLENKLNHVVSIYILQLRSDHSSDDSSQQRRNWMLFTTAFFHNVMLLHPLIMNFNDQQHTKLTKNLPRTNLSKSRKQ